MEDILYYSDLYDYYGKLFTDIQRTYFEEYYFNNLSLQEIADNYNVSKNAVSKCLKDLKEKLDYYEEVLSLNKNKNKIISLLDEDTLSKIEEYI